MSYGEGSIKRYLTRDGRERFHVRIPDGKGGHKSIGSYESEAEAVSVRAAALQELRNSPCLHGTFGTFGETWLGRLRDQRSIRSSRSRWMTHVLPSELGQMPTEDLQPSHLRDFARALPKRVSVRTGKPISRQTVIHVWGLVCRCLAEAVTDGLLPADPSAGVRLSLPKGKRAWTYLQPAELTAVLALPDLTEQQKTVIQLATFQGLRQGEIAALTWECVDIEAAQPTLRVESSWDRPATKNGEHRTIPVLPPAVAVLGRWRALSGRSRGLVFPAPAGGLYATGYDWRWGERGRHGYLDIPTRAGITRRITFHALRHTCGSALVNGFWGERWSLEAVRDFLGHSSVSMTEKYAHLEDAVMHAAAAATTGKPAQVIALPVAQQPAQDMESNMESLADQVAARVLQALGTTPENANGQPRARLGISSHRSRSSTTFGW